MNKFLFFILIFSISAKAQKVKVLEFGTKFPIENVAIFNDDNSKLIYTNKKGIADLSKFTPKDVISFNHLSFIEYDILKRDLKVLDYTVYLHKKAEELNEIILSASKGKEQRRRIAEQIDVIAKENIVKMAPQTSADLLANMAGIRVQKSQFGGGSPVLRGMEANKVLLVVDGVRMNNAIYRTGHLQNSITVSPNILDRVEVIFGPSSVIYGSDALGGVIHYYTKTPKISAKNQVNTSVYNRFSTINNEFTTSESIELRFKKWASYTNVSYSKFGDLKMGKSRNHGYKNWGKVFEYSNNTNTYYNPNPVVNSNPNIQKNTAYNQTDILQKLVFPLSKKEILIFNFQYTTSSNINRFDKLNEYKNGTLKFAEWHYGPQNRLLLSSQLKINPNNKWLKKGTITAAYQNSKESRIQRKFSSLKRSYRKENVDVISLNGDFFVPLTKEDNRILSYGFEFAYNKVNSNAYGKTLDVVGNTIIGFNGNFDVQSRYPDGGSNYTSLASYINYRQDLSTKSTLNTGIRYSSNFLNAKWIDNTFITLPKSKIAINNSAVTATIGYAYKPSKNWQLNSLISSGFRAPNIDDVGKIREKNGNVTVPNINLKPEYAYNFEINGLKYFNNRKFSMSLSTYYILLNNYITRDYFKINNSSTIIYDGEEGNVVANVNKGNAYILGGTYSFTGKINNYLTSKASLTYTKGKAYDTHLPLSSIPPLFGSFEIGYQKNKFQASINWRFNAQKKLKDYNLVEGIDNVEQTPFNPKTNFYEGNPSWSIFNINTNYRFNNSITAYLKLDNIFDIHYKEFASSISNAGRNISISLLINN
ncbi:TonB-dependent receptor [Lutibacter sp.]|uniref:TonB-dependent receptor plug domain-containing protein n=1 Tax=Lutibacter sp. TaxID=1925666 RepID=UPI0025C5B5FF|nr:TonB-dependent receptor [Lutibacter sp.]MCF6180615.1 TonB-dependent receptor [Lutibacter sp.]